MRQLLASILVSLVISCARAQDGPSTAGAFQYIGKSNCVGVQLIAIPDSDSYLFMERPSSPHPDGKHNNACLMDAVTGKSTNIDCSFSMENCGHTYFENGTVAVLGGHKPQSNYPEGRKSIQVLDQEKNGLVSVGTLQFGHWLATVTRLPNGMITVMSDSPSPVGPTRKDNIENPFYELWDPANPGSTKAIQLNKAFATNAKYFYYPRVFVLPTGDLFVWHNTYGEIIKPLTGKTVVVVPNWKKIAKAKGMQTSYPFSGTAAMLPLRPENNYTVVEIMVFGGAWGSGWINTTAVDLSMRLKITIKPNGTYDFGSGWQMEVMPSPRVSGTSILLPNGDVLLINGAKRGQLGDAAAGGVAMLNEPNFWPALYDPSAAEGNRYTELGRSQIARLLHSTAGLTPNGTVILAGGDRSDRFWCPVEYSRSPTGYPEYRVELFVPPVVFNTQHRPTIVNAPIDFGPSEVVTIEYTLPVADAVVTSVVLVAPSSDTHTNGMHQRVVEMQILGTDTDGHIVSAEGDKTVTVRAPPNTNVAPAGPYMLFLLYGKTYGPAQWVYFRSY